ncbi:MAG: hypothetical protein R3234_01170, partial [Thermoanaerobaculia bacterium]|nr:hypothetical protein [Thermoanaerobaculia bacterium]
MDRPAVQNIVDRRARRRGVGRIFAAAVPVLLWCGCASAPSPEATSAEGAESRSRHLEALTELHDG